ncbi:MAG: hypothetical protein H0W29_07050 [Gemmatimonadales bacterium]|nr:hypothetical protein [Gemmatimonadales bacterium]
MTDALAAAVAAYHAATTANQKRGRWRVAVGLALAAQEEGHRLDRTARKMDAWLVAHPSEPNEQKLIRVFRECGAIHAAVKGAEGVLGCP